MQSTSCGAIGRLKSFWRGPLPKVILVCVVAVCLLTVFFRMSGNSDIDVLPEIRERGYGAYRGLGR